MKRFMVFSFDQYYPAGALGDCVASYDELSRALAHFNNSNTYRYDYSFVWDRIEDKEYDMD